jgi:hypothetical protein
VQADVVDEAMVARCLRVGHDAMIEEKLDQQQGGRGATPVPSSSFRRRTAARRPRRQPEHGN